MLPFETRPPLFDEEAQKRGDLSPAALAQALAEGKALSLQSLNLVVIGGDQLVAFEGQILGKPGTRDKAIEQLTAMSGKTHELMTAICVTDGMGRVYEHLDCTQITFKNLSRALIEHVVDRDQPFDCAGSYKIEKHGIALIESVKTEDFTSIQGLPLLALSRMLKACEIETV